MIEFSWKKLFRFPGPKELGLSKHNSSMPSRDFPPHDGRPTWEDYEDKLKELFPARFFLAYTARNFLRYKCWFPMTRPIKTAWYKAKCHVLPSHRFHWLDLRQKKSDISSSDNYSYGYQEPAERMLYAMFNLLNEYVDKCEPYVPTEKHIEETPEEEGKIHLIRQRDSHLEILAIYNWWNVERKVAAKVKNTLRDEWWNTRKAKPFSVKAEAAHKALRDAEEAFDAKEEEMTIRLMKIRPTLWT